MAKVAKLVYVNLLARVIVDEFDDDEKIFEMAHSNLSNQLNNGVENIEKIVDDIECPYEVDLRLSKEGRNAFYKELLEVVTNAKNDGRYTLGLCYYITHKVNHTKINVYDENVFETVLPELYAGKPEGPCNEWFQHTYSGLEKRIALIVKAIEETE